MKEGRYLFLNSEDRFGRAAKNNNGFHSSLVGVCIPLAIWQQSSSYKFFYSEFCQGLVSFTRGGLNVQFK